MIKNLKNKLIIGVMGGANVSEEHAKMAFELGALIAEQGWITLNGGRNAGIMLASSEGAKSKGGVTIGVLPGHDRSGANPFIDIPIVTGMSDARNLINVLSSHIVIACPGSAGTVSEVSLALKNNIPVILLQFDLHHVFPDYIQTHLLTRAETPKDCIRQIQMRFSI